MSRPIVVGVVKYRAGAVVSAAAVFARHFGADLICVAVDEGRYLVEESADGSIASLPMDPDLSDMRVETFDPGLRAQIADALQHDPVEWSTRALVGDAADSIRHLAKNVDAVMIVVGTRRPSFGGTVREFVNGSVAARLAHRQHLPVVVIPLRPVGVDDELPWNGNE